MSKKTKLIAIMVAMAVLTSALVAGGVVLAQTSTPAPSTQAGGPAATLLSKVATILGIDEQELKDAVSQAERQLVDEAISQKLADAVTKGIISQEQADRIEAWLAKRLDIDLPTGRLPRGVGRILGNLQSMRQHMGLANSALVEKVAAILGIDAQQLADAVKQAHEELASEMLDKRLAEAVARGLITQEQADEIKQWLSQKPDFLTPGLLQRFPGAIGPRGMGERHMPPGRGMFRDRGFFQMHPGAGSGESTAEGGALQELTF